MRCLLCQSRSDTFSQDKKREYKHCKHCDLIFVPLKYHLSPSQEKKEYDQHENDSSDCKYRNFLNQALIPLEKYLIPGMQGLDFGSGPGPTLHLMLEEKGYLMKHYDPFFAPHDSLLHTQYDFVTSTEVVEHFNHPQKSWSLLASLVKKGGYLAVVTLFWDSVIKANFSTWWYKNIPSHVVFYFYKTLGWIGKSFSLHLIYAKNRVAVFQKLR
ncbi:MAG: class I SAM-dependent methyltransferase [Simkaniaceae bacterium]